MTCDIGIVGLGVMGGNLALNMERHGFRVAGYDVDGSRASAFAGGPAAGRNIEVASSPDGLMAALRKPRRLLLMVPAGPAVDNAIAHVKEHLQAGDILVDGGNSYFLDTERRCKALAAEGYDFVGAGISGGEEGALRGPSIMAGGQPRAWEALAPILRAIAAKADDGEPCAAYMGPGGAGHYVKMVHNGIEYADMQLIAETYDILSRGLGLSAGELVAVFAEWNRGELKSYLIEVTAAVLAKIDPDTGRPLVDLILDEAQQKGTGKWVCQNALDVGAPVPSIAAAVDSRILTALGQERAAASRVLHGPSPRYGGERQALIDATRDALYSCKITSYAQGFGLLRLASAEYGYGLKPADIAGIWRAGCIIRAAFLGEIMAAYRRNPELVSLLVGEPFRAAIQQRQAAWRFVAQAAIGMGIPVAAMSASLAYYDAYRSERLPANLTQAQRDFFGAHTYRRVDRPGVFHTEW